MKKFMTIVFAIVMLLLTLFASGGMMGTGATIAGMQSVVRGDVGTFIMTDGAAYMLAWPKGENYAWTVISNARGVDLNAVRNNATTLSKLLLDLEKNGFYYVSFDQLPKGIVETVLGYSVTTVMTGVRSFPSIFVVPLMIFEPTPTVGVTS